MNWKKWISEIICINALDLPMHGLAYVNKQIVCCLVVWITVTLESIPSRVPICQQYEIVSILNKAWCQLLVKVSV